MSVREAIAVVGAGSWGTALAVLLARNGETVSLWARDPGHAARMEQDRVNERYLPDVELPAGLAVHGELDAALAGARDVLIAVPSHAFAGCLDAVVPALAAHGVLAWATKGFEPDTGRFLDALVVERLGEDRPRALLSGPSFAGEVARGLPTAVTLAGSDAGETRRLAARFHGGEFRVYTTDDLIGVQVGGAVKNVLAIASGIADGLGFGANARAALVTRGLHEVTRLGVRLGGRAETFVGLAGLGDLLLTCTDDQSRNRRFGIALARGNTVAEAEAAVGQVVEGLGNTRETVRLARRVHVEMPIASQVEQVLYHGVAPEAAVRALLARAPKPESA